MKHITLVCQTISQIPELLRLGRLLATSDRWKISLVVMFQPEPDMINRCRESGIHIRVCSRINQERARRIKLPICWSWLLDRLSSSAGWVIRLTRFYHRIVGTLQPDLIILPEDNVSLWTGLMVRYAHRRGIPVAVLPFTFTTPAEAAESFFPLMSHHIHGFLNRYVSWTRPNWVLNWKGRPLLRLPGVEVLLMEIVFGYRPATPWILESGDSDVILVQSRRMHRHYLQQGIPETQLVLTGGTMDDAIHQILQNRRQHRANLDKRYDLRPDWPLICCALPPDQGPAKRAGCAFSTYDDLLAYWVRTIQQLPGFNSIFHLHPRSRSRDAALIRELGGRLAIDDLPCLLPLCDVFVASISATIRWAIACAKPVVNYDVYHYRYEDYHDVPGVLTVTSKDAFTRVLQRLTDATYRQHLTQSQEQIANDWAELDGHTTERVQAALHDLLARYQDTDPPARCPPVKANYKKRIAS